MLNEFVYCPRLFFYEWVDGVFRHNSDTVEGAQKHEKGDEKENALPSAEALEGERVKSGGLIEAPHARRRPGTIEFPPAAAGGR